MKFCAEIQYHDDYTEGTIHSDLCWHCEPKAEGEDLTAEYRKLLHDCLDEWLDRSRGTGAFWLGNADHLSRMFAQSEI